MLTTNELSVQYGMHTALKSVSMSVAADEIVVILGANGAGKSTLLKAIAGVCEGQTEGDISLSGHSLLQLDAATIVEHGIAFVPEGRGIFADLSVHENLVLGAYSNHAREKQADNLVRVLDLFPKLEERKRQIVRTMSGGEQQMVAIGRALMSAPSILMLDEPSLGLSPLLCKDLFRSLKQVRDSGVGILLVEQNAKQSLGIADRGYLLENGKITGENSASNMLNDPAVLAAYLGGAISKKSMKSTTAGSSLLVPRTSASLDNSMAAQLLAREDISSMVAKASRTASRSRDPVAAIRHPKSASSVIGTKQVATLTEPTIGIERLDNDDRRVSALLADFEAAARRAASGSSTSADSRRRKTVSIKGTVLERAAEQETLPHIPVYRKPTVTVYRRDSAGKLRRQQES